MEDLARLAVLEQNVDPATFQNILQKLLTTLTNIVKCPEDHTCRVLNLDLITKQKNIDGFLDYLKYLGFQNSGTEVFYPEENNIEKLKYAQNAIQRKLNYLSDSCTKSNTKVMRFNDYVIKKKQPDFRATYILATKNPFLKNIEEYFNIVLRYENEELKKIALEYIPLEILQIKSLQRMRAHQRLLKKGETCGAHISFDIALLTELIEWYKYNFFKWVDKLDCDKCGGSTVYEGKSSLVTTTEHCSVEIYKCIRCRETTKFPRYNDPLQLLRTRRGRCGEWANCFMLFCRALCYDTRFVLDTEDHVWCEVFDYESNRWLHVDPCEAKIDRPLIYEHGWGKKLQYVTAFSCDDVQDVTWRYSSCHKEILSRRKLCSEVDLIHTLIILREERQKQVSEARKKYLTKRSLQELVQLMSEKKPADHENQGRISGSEAWKRQRGELGMNNGHTFFIEQPGRYIISYNCAFNQYKVMKGNIEQKSITDWSEGVFEYNNIFRKEEKDWKMVYLARKDGETTGEISWKISTGNSGLQFFSLSISLTSMLYENGFIDWAIKFDDEEWTPARFNNSLMFFNKTFNEVIFTAELSGGKGDVSWQHAQLFRQALDDKSSGMEVTVTM